MCCGCEAWRKEVEPCRSLPAVAPATVYLIDMDLRRTMSDEEAVKLRRGWIRAILLRHVGDDPGLGYCQGMTLVAATFAAASGSPREAYARFRAFTGRLRSLWLPGFPLLRSAMTQFEDVAQAQSWFKHLRAHGVDTSMYLPQALLTFFGMWLPVPTLLECLGLLERSNILGLVAMAVAVLDSAADRLLRLETMDELLFELQRLKDAAPEPGRLMEGANAALKAAEQATHAQQPVVALKSTSVESFWDEDWTSRTWRELLAWMQST